MDTWCYHQGRNQGLAPGQRVDHHYQELVPEILTESGVRQGCVLAPSLFCRAVDRVLKESLHPSGLTVSDKQFSDIDYADDIAVVDENSLNQTENLERMEGA